MKIVLWLIAATALAFNAPAHAQGFPAKPIRLIVTYPPGGGADLMARLIAPKMAETLGQPVVVENKAGASGQIAALDVARSPPDGYTLMLDASSFAVNPSLYAKLPYDPAKAFTPIAVVALFPNVLVVTASFPAKDVKGLIALAKAHPGELAFASSGNGSAQHLSAELFKEKAGVEMTHVPYKGGGPALNDVVGGQVPMYFANMASGLPFVKNGRLRALAVTSAKRSAALPDVPTIAESGLAGYEVYEWNAIFAPAGTPTPVIAKLADAIARAMDSPLVRQRVAELGGEIPGYGPAEASRFVHEQAELWGRVVREAHITVQ
ncbi:MAG TPA: tripartite tricarboxylate transporter substrate binding protein [Usitatibacter sp.]|jgi:tripartite-type tricarboxylate transporter receptor subunit TctC|nr:tripartite tricarboxylate transporter substrate binding protein [Usitatibacter sp.]